MFDEEDDEDEGSSDMLGMFDNSSISCVIEFNSLKAFM